MLLTLKLALSVVDRMHKKTAAVDHVVLEALFVLYNNDIDMCSRIDNTGRVVASVYICMY